MAISLKGGHGGQGEPRVLCHRDDPYSHRVAASYRDLHHWDTDISAKWGSSDLAIEQTHRSGVKPRSQQEVSEPPGTSRHQATADEKRSTADHARRQRTTTAEVRNPPSQGGSAGSKPGFEPFSETGTAGYLWAFNALAASPGAKAHYRRRREHGDWHNAALRNLFNRQLGILHHCLTSRQTYQETKAFPQPADNGLHPARIYRFITRGRASSRP